MQLTLKDIKKLLKGHFDSVELIESGSASKARFNETGIVLFKTNYNNRLVALKCFIDVDENKQNLQRAEKEYNYLNFLKPVSGVVDVYELIALEDDHDNLTGYVLVEDYLPETLREYIRKGKKLNDKQIASFLKQMDKTLKALHFNKTKPIIHCDIKPSNIGIKKGIDGDKYILFDFDIAMESNGDREVSFSKLLGLTPEYSAPEVLNGISNANNDNLISNKADIYSIGVIALQLALNKKTLTGSELIQSCKSLSLKSQSIICPLLAPIPINRSPVVLAINNRTSYADIINNNKLLIIVLLSLITLVLSLLSLTLIIK